MPITGSTKKPPAGDSFTRATNPDVMTVLAELLSNQHVFFAGVSKYRRNAWGGFPKRTQAITPDTSISQLQWSLDGGLKKTPTVHQLIIERCDVENLEYANLEECDMSEEAFVKAAGRGEATSSQVGTSELPPLEQNGLQ